MKTTLLLTAALVVLLPLAAGADTFEPNNSVVTAHGPLSNGVAIQSFINDAFDVDWYYFDAEVGDLSISLTGIPTGTDYDLYLTDEAENIFAFSDNSDNADELIVGQVTGSGRFWIRVETFEGFSPSSAYSLTANFVTGNTAPVVTVNYPNGGETLTAGSSVNLLWTASDVEDGAAVTIDIEYSANNGGLWSPVATGTTNDGNHPWTVPAQTTTQGLIRVTATDTQSAAVSDASNAVFTIGPGIVPELTLSLPEVLLHAGSPPLELPLSFSSNVSVGALQFALVFHPVAYQPQLVEAGPRAGGLTMESNLGVEGQVRVVFYSTAGGALDPGSGVICTVDFDVSGYVSGGVGWGIGVTDVVASDPLGNALPVTVVDSTTVAVRAVTLTAEAAAEGVHLRWTATADGAHAGFRVLREDMGQPVLLHTGLLAADARSYTDHDAAPDRTHIYWLEAVERDGSTQRFGPVEVFVAAGPLWAGVPYPNPARETVQIDFRSAPGVPVTAVVVDLNGRVVRELEVPTAGTLAWDGRLSSGLRAPAGVYFLHVRQGGHAVTRRVVRLAGR